MLVTLSASLRVRAVRDREMIEREGGRGAADVVEMAIEIADGALVLHRY
jgi:hypothetical protein